MKLFNLIILSSLIWGPHAYAQLDQWTNGDTCYTNFYSHEAYSVPFYGNNEIEFHLAILGGRTDGFYSYSNRVELFDIETGEWDTLSPLPERRADHVVIAGYSLVFIAGGVNQFGLVGDILQYDLKTGQSAVLTTFEIGRRATGVDFGGGGGYFICGGTDQYGTTAYGRVVIYKDGMFSDNYDPLITPRFGHLAEKIDGSTIIVMGGRDAGGTILASAEKYTLGTDQWFTADQMSVPRIDFTVTKLLDGKILVTGGYGGTGALNSADIYRPSNNVWNSVSDFSEARERHSAALLPDGRVIIIGGYDINFSPLATTEIYDPALDTWTSGPTLSTPRASHACAVLEDSRVMVTGGFKSISGITKSTEFLGEVLMSDEIGSGISEGTIDLQVYPVPTEERIFLSISAKSNGKRTARIFDIQGRMAKEVTLSQAAVNKVEISDLETGIYLVQFVEDGITVATGRFLVQ